VHLPTVCARRGPCQALRSGRLDKARQLHVGKSRAVPTGPLTRASNTCAEQSAHAAQRGRTPMPTRAALIGPHVRKIPTVENTVKRGPGEGRANGSWGGTPPNQRPCQGSLAWSLKMTHQGKAQQRAALSHKSSERSAGTGLDYGRRVRKCASALRSGQSCGEKILARREGHARASPERAKPKALPERSALAWGRLARKRKCALPGVKQNRPSAELVSEDDPDVGGVRHLHDLTAPYSWHGILPEAVPTPSVVAHSLRPSASQYRLAD
jgi:hypothetical protein